MKKIGFILLLLSFVACKDNETKNKAEEKTNTLENTSENLEGYDSYGASFSAENALDPIQMQERFKQIKEGDTVKVTFETKVLSVCKEKGCWMKLIFPNDDQTMVKFKDYAFFVPKDIEGKMVIVNGKAYVSDMSVDLQQHYAKDGGKSEDEILAITEPKRTLSVMADGVLIKK